MKRSARALVSGGAAVAAAAAVAVAVATTAPDTPGGTGRTGGTVDLGPVQRVALQNFGSCEALLAYYREHARTLVGPYGLSGNVTLAATGGVDIAAGAEAGTSAAAPRQAADGAAAKGTTSATGTNVQVSGVDEADVAKLSGNLLLTITRGALRVSRVEGGSVRPVGEFGPTDWQPQQLLVEGRRALLIGSAAPSLDYAKSRGSSDTDIAMAALQSRLAEIDLSDPGKPRLVRTLDVDGMVQGARLVDGVARLAVTSSPTRLRWKPPSADRNGNVSEAALRRATERNRALVARAGLDSWLPAYELTEYDAQGRRDGDLARGRLLDCAKVASPREFAGLETLSLLSMDLRSQGAKDWAASGVVAAGSTVYATATNTYVATSGWQQPVTKERPLRPSGEGVHTAVHLFTSTDRTGSRYVASGEVPGTLIGQFAMDEHEGRLRVASTTQPGFGPVPIDPMPVEPMPVVPGTGAGDERSTGDEGSTGEDTSVSRPARSPEPTQSQVTVLERRGRNLAEVGSVGGLGKGETIHAVRFMGDVGYVVTFRRTDPLYTIDLSDPRRPTVAGELKVLGYSAYLHPAGPGRLLGVGQDADRQGRVSGMQMSLFDVSDPAAPRRLDAVGLDGAWSDVEGDHHAFTFADGLALAPYQVWTQRDPLREETEFDAGVLAVRVGDTDLSAAARLRPVADGPVAFDKSRETTVDPVLESAPRRTFVRDGVVLTVTEGGIATHDARTLKRIAFARL